MKRDISYLGAFICIGVGLTYVGPVLGQLQARAGVSVSTIGLLFSAQSVGYLVGSVVAGRLYDRGLGHRVMASGLLLVASGLMAIAFARSLPSMLVAVVLLGVASGVVDVGGNTLLVWSRTVGIAPWMNALHLFFAAGALATPVLVAGGRAVPALVGGVLCVVMGANLMTQPSPPVRVHETQAAETPRRPMLLVALFFFLYVGAEVGFAGWLHSYGGAQGLSSRGATILTTLFWMGFALGRLVSIGAARRVAAEHLLVGGAIAVVVAALFVLFGRGGPLIWPSAFAMGLATAPQFASMMVYASERMAFSGAATSTFIGASAVGGIVLPWCMGQGYDRAGAWMMPAVVLVCGVGLVATIMALRRELGDASQLRALQHQA